LPKSGFHPRAWLDAILTYPRFLGTIKPELMRSEPAAVAPRLQLYQESWWPKRLRPPLGNRILVLSPHPDDEAIGCGGLLLAHKECAEIRIVNVYNGDGGGQLPEGPWRNDHDYRARLTVARAAELDKAANAFRVDNVIRFGVSDCDGEVGAGEIAKLRMTLDEFVPDLVVLPWMLDRHPHHLKVNELFLAAAHDRRFMVLGYEIWGPLFPNAFLDITDHLSRKLEIISIYETQTATVDYQNYAKSLAHTRGFHLGVGEKRAGAAECFLALPCRDYCDLVRHVMG
jgi:LmbE family N-acetylglucosaminyl deacetylase